MQIEPHAHPVRAGLFLRRRLRDRDATLAQQIIRQAKIDPMPRARRLRQPLAHAIPSHHPLVRALRRTHPDNRLALTGGKCQHIIQPTLPQRQ